MAQFVPMPTSFHDGLIAWVPKTLAGTTYQFIETAQGFARPEVPAIVAWFGNPVPIVGHSLIRTVRNPNFWMDDYWGSKFSVTLFVSLRAYDSSELSAMWLDFIRQVDDTRRDRKIQFRGWEFKEILRSEAIPMDNTPESATGDQVYMAQIDLKFEFEVASVSDADYIRKANQSLYVNEAETPMTIVSEVFERTLTCALRAYVEE